MPAINHLLIQVVPRLTPQKCGISDHAIRLAKELKTAFGIDSAFIVLNSDEKCNVPYQVIYSAPAQLRESCASLTEGRPGALLVHLSGYGYSRDGAPAHLAEALANVNATGQFRVAVYFHELFATGMPWKSAFWHSRRQKNAIRKIAEESNLVITNTRHHANWLQHESAVRSGTSVQILPMFSNVGEAQEPVPMALRESALAVFGLPATRRRAYKDLSSLGAALNRLGIKEILDIGPNLEAPSKVSGIPVRRVGPLAAADISSRLSQTMFGFLSYPPAFLAKSGIFASYCAEGTIPLIALPFDGEIDGLKDGVQLFSPRTVDRAIASGLDRCSRAAWQWYSLHRIHAHAATYAHWLNQSSLLHLQKQATV
jgi:hypothetical protein